jgi:hypothetical protein
MTPGISATVGSRVARASYGTVFSTRWIDGGRFRAADKVWSPTEGCHKAANQMRWFLRQGDDVSGKQLQRQPAVVKHPFYIVFDAAAVPAVVETVVYCSRQTPPPTCRTAAVDRVCSISWHPAAILDRLQPIATPARKYRVEYEIQMRCSGVSVEFCLVHRGETMARGRVPVDFGGEGGTPATMVLGREGVAEPPRLAGGETRGGPAREEGPAMPARTGGVGTPGTKGREARAARAAPRLAATEAAGAEGAEDREPQSKRAKHKQEEESWLGGIQEAANGAIMKSVERDEEVETKEEADE